MHIPFHVANKDQAYVNVVLGRQWIGMTNCQINWTTREYLLKVNSTDLTGTSSEVETSQVSTPLPITSTKASPSKTSRSTSQPQQQPKGHMPEAQLRKIPTSKSPSYDQSLGKGELHTTQKWIPKAIIAHQQTHLHQNLRPNHGHQQS